MRFGVGSVSVAICTSEAAITTIGEVADYLKVTERTIYRLAVAPDFRIASNFGTMYSK